MVLPNGSMSKAEVPCKGPVPAPGASKVVMVCADIEVDIARAMRMIAAGTSWSFLVAK